MTHDPRNWQQGGQEYAPHQVARPSDAHAASGQAQPYSPPHVGEVYQQPGHQAPLQPPQPAMRAAPVGYELPAATAPVAVPAAPAAAPVADENVVVLSKPYQAHGEMVSRIVLRRPVAREIKQCGNPLKMVTAPDGRIVDMEIKWDVVTKYIPLLASPPLPPSTVDQFDFFDLDACAAVLAPFFVKLA